MRARRPEIERAAITRVYGVTDPSDPVNPEYTEGLRAAVSAALNYCFDIVELGERRPPSVPSALLMQARLAARSGVQLETVFRRYFAGYTLLGDFLVEEAQHGDLLGGPEFKGLLRAQASRFDHLVTAITKEYTRESKGLMGTAEQRRVEYVERLLDGELVYASEFGYDLGVHHLGLIAVGPEAPEVVRSLAKSLDRRLLAVRRGDGTIWAWLGGRGSVAPDDLKRLVSPSWPTRLSLAVGESAHGYAGWCRTHQQARATLTVVLRSPQSLTRYADAALRASMLSDGLLASSLHELFLAPLSKDRDGGATLRQTLRAYFRVERNVSSTAAALGVSRQTVSNRLRTIEERLARPLSDCAAEIDAALRLEELEYHPTPYPAFPSADIH